MSSLSSVSQTSFSHIPAASTQANSPQAQSNSKATVDTSQMHTFSSIFSQYNPDSSPFYDRIATAVVTSLTAGVLCSTASSSLTGRLISFIAANNLLSELDLFPPDSPIEPDLLRGLALGGVFIMQSIPVVGPILAYSMAGYLVSKAAVQIQGIASSSFIAGAAFAEDERKKTT